MMAVSETTIRETFEQPLKWVRIIMDEAISLGFSHEEAYQLAFQYWTQLLGGNTPIVTMMGARSPYSKKEIYKSK